MTPKEQSIITHLETAVTELTEAGTKLKSFYVNDGKMSKDSVYEIMKTLWGINAQLANADTWFGEIQKISTIQKIKTLVEV